MKPICFVASSEEFLFGHFLPGIASAKARNTEVIALIPGGTCGNERYVDGVRLISIPIERSTNTSWVLLAEAVRLTSALRKLDPAVVVAYSLRMCVATAFAQIFVRSSSFVFVVTGLGFLGIAGTLRTRLARSVIFWLLRHVSRSRSYFLFENAFDPLSTGIARRGYRFSILMGAGINQNEFSTREIPRGVQIRFATVSRLIWSKGVDLAVAVISSLASEGYPVELHIHGAPDYSNPRPVNPDTFKNMPGIYYHGHTDRVADVWNDNHAAIFVSRGGEGLPRALLEAAASARPCIVTAVPGCVDFVRNGVEGYVAPHVSEASVREAVLKLLAAPDEMFAMGRRAQDRVRATSTTEIVMDKYESVFRSPLEEAEGIPCDTQPAATGDRALSDPVNAEL